MTGDDLKRARKARGLSRRALAHLTGLHPDSVRYWERKPRVDLRGYAPDRMLKALGLGSLSLRDVYPSERFLAALGGNYCTVMRARGGVLGPGIRRAGSQRCGARTRKGTPCRAKPMPGKTRCRFHGGASTGPRTEEGKARIAEAQRRRWAAWRAGREEIQPHSPSNALILLS